MFLNLKDFLLYKYICIKCIFRQIWKEIVENEDLYKNKDDFWFFSDTKKLLFFNLKDFIFYKHICNMYTL